MHGTSRGPAYPPRPRREPRGRRGAGPPRANKSKKRRAPLGKGGWHVVKWAGERVGEHRVAASTDGVRRGAARRSRGAARGGAIPGCACRLAGRGGANVRHGGCGGRETPVRAARHATPVSRGADPVRGPTSTTPLGRGSGGGGAVVAGTRPGGRAGTPSPGVVAGRAGTPRHATRGLCGGRGSPVGRSVAPQLWPAHLRRPSQNITIRASKGMTCPDLGEIGFGRGRGFSQVVFPAPLLLV